jgi:hypothetical protein
LIITVGNFSVKIGGEYWLAHEENNSVSEYKHYIPNVHPDKAKDIKVDFYYPTDLDLIYKFKSPNNKSSSSLNFRYFLTKSINPYGSKCCNILITNLQTKATNIGRIVLSSGSISSNSISYFVADFCKDLENSNSIPDWRTKQLISFLQPEIDYLLKEINNLDYSKLTEWKEYLVKFKTEFDFYLPFMKKRGVDIAEYLQLLESKM